MLKAGMLAGARRQLARMRGDWRGELRALWRRGLWRVARRLTPELAVEAGDVRLYVSTADWIIGRRLFVYRHGRQEDAARAFAALRSLPGMEQGLAGRRVLEIGANIGSTTVELLRHLGAGGVTAVEPDPENFRLLRQNVIANGVADRAQLLQLALSDTDGSVALELSATNSGDHRVRVIAEDEGEEARRDTIEVRAARVDSLVASGEVDLEGVALVWLDAQGHEAQILAGAATLLEAGIPIALEYWPYGLRRAGGLERLHELIAASCTHVIDLASPTDGPPRVLPASELPGLEQAYGWGTDSTRDATDLIVARTVTADTL